jgi:hypothetical protein
VNPETDDAPSPTPETKKIAPDDLARMVAATETTTAVRRASEPSGGALRKKLLGAVLLAAVGVGASIMSCVGQSFSYRQARAMEGIEQQLKEIRAGCTISPREATK